MSWRLLSARLAGDGAAVLTAQRHSVPEMCTLHNEDPTRALAARAGEEIALEYNQPALPVPGQPDTEPILRVASIMQVCFRACGQGLVV